METKNTLSDNILTTINLNKEIFDILECDNEEDTDSIIDKSIKEYTELFCHDLVCNKQNSNYRLEILQFLINFKKSKNQIKIYYSDSTAPVIHNENIVKISSSRISEYIFRNYEEGGFNYDVKGILILKNGLTVAFKGSVVKDAYILETLVFKDSVSIMYSFNRVIYFEDTVEGVKKPSLKISVRDDYSYDPTEYKDKNKILSILESIITYIYLTVSTDVSQANSFKTLKINNHEVIVID